MKNSIASPAKLFGDWPLHQFRVFTAMAPLVAGTAPAAAADGASPDQWEVGVEVYLWGASVGGNTATNTGIDISFGDLLEDVEMGFMGAVGVQKGKWSLLGDVIYGDLGASENTTVDVAGNPVDVNAEIDQTAWIVTLAGGYAAIQTEDHTLNVLIGARYLDMDVDLNFAIGGISDSFSGSGDAWDGIIGVKGQADFTEKWYFSYYLDIGTGDTDFTWQALGGFGYQFKHLDAVFGYRYLDWEFDDGDPLAGAFNNVDIHGPYAGVKFIF